MKIKIELNESLSIDSETAKKVHELLRKGDALIGDATAEFLAAKKKLLSLKLAGVSDETIDFLIARRLKEMQQQFV